MRILFFMLIILSLNGQAQDFSKEINDQVWKPFIKTFNDYESDAFLALHSKEVIRSSRDSKQILNWEQYLLEQKRGDDWAKAKGYKRTLELRFTERIANEKQAIDVGIYKTTNIANGETRSYYGRFHVVLRKEDGQWKIVVDTDSSEGHTISEEHFLKAQAME